MQHGNPCLTVMLNSKIDASQLDRQISTAVYIQVSIDDDNLKVDIFKKTSN